MLTPILKNSTFKSFLKSNKLSSIDMPWVLVSFDDYQQQFVGNFKDPVSVLANFRPGNRIAMYDTSKKSSYDKMVIPCIGNAIFFSRVAFVNVNELAI